MSEQRAQNPRDRFIVKFQQDGKVQRCGSIFDTFAEAYDYATALIVHHSLSNRPVEAWAERDN